MRRAALVLVLAALAGCPGDDDSGPPPLFAEDYALTFEEVRDCRMSGDHDFRPVRVLANPAALVPYRDRAAPFPDGAIVLKEEYDFAADDCSGPVVEWTVMRKAAAATDALGWDWQRIDATRTVTESDPRACTGCHELCGVAPDGYDGTCTVE